MKKEYLEILEISQQATLQEIKKAYRDKAKLYHPDVSQDPDAHEKFILLNEAYEYFHDLRTGKIKITRTRTTANQKGRTAPNTQKKSYKTTYTGWSEADRAKARARAAYHAKQKYTEYVNSDYYKSAEAMFTIIDQVVYVLAVMNVCLPILGSILFGWGGFFGGIVIVFISVFSWAPILKGPMPLDWKSFQSSWKLIVQTKTFAYLATSVITFFIFFRIAVNTMIPLHYTVCLIAAAFMLSYLLTKKAEIKIPALFKILLAPSVINLFFLTNYLFSSGASEEIYFYNQHADQGNTTYIYLENDIYDEYAGLRLFQDYKELRNKKKILFEFEEGLFGIRVLKSYKFF